MLRWRSNPQSEGDRQSYLSVSKFAISTTPTFVLARAETAICDPGKTNRPIGTAVFGISPTLIAAEA